LIKRKENGVVETSIYRKSYNSNRYLAFSSEHPLCTKKAVATNLFRRAAILTTSVSETQKESEFISSVLNANGYNKNILNAARVTSTTAHTEQKQWLTTVVIPYRRNTSEDIRRTLNQYNIRIAFQATNTLRKNLVHLKDPQPRGEQVNCVYMLHCNDCESCYVGQTARQLNVRVKEHERCCKKQPRNAEQLERLERDSAIAVHALLTDHRVDFEQPKILKHGFRTYKERLLTEALLFNCTPYVVNRSDGSDLSAIWQSILA
jgi:hypothetical protein